MKITPDEFEQQCKHRYGIQNPDRMHIAHWENMVRSGVSAYRARRDIGLEGIHSPGPEWSFDRFGKSRTRMSDGRIICIAGEHEDFYDSDFCIYNDVIVLRPSPGTDEITPDSGEVEIYGYPDTDFPPTDFHSATLVNDTIFLIGRLGYRGSRQQGATPVFKLDTQNYRIEEVQPRGTCPGWIYRHHASYDQGLHAITVRGGARFIEGARAEPSYTEVHRLHLADLCWERIALHETHERFEIAMNESDHCELGDLPANVFRPTTVPHAWLYPEMFGVWIYKLDVQGVRITFKCFYSRIEVYVEGELPPDLIDQLLSEIIGNLCAVTKCEWGLTKAQQSLDN